ncbi:MAG: flippase-like domain-containing protein [Chloroflexota bacterium]|nr:MAG: flippase-like domain-containing protein [Chloroflexota bacterium]
MKKRLFLALVVTLVIGAAFFWLVDLNQVITLLRQADWRLLAAGIGALLVAYMLMAVRWRYLLANRTGFLPSFHAINISNLVNSLTPIPEIAVRVLITGRGADMSISGATSGMLVERSLEQVMRVLAFLLALLTGYVISFKTESMLVNAGLILVFLGLMVWLIRNAESIVGKVQVLLHRFPRLDQKQVEKALTDLVTGLRMAGGPKQLTYGWLMSFAIWGAFFAFAYLVLLGLHIYLPIEQMAAIALLTLAVAPPSAPGTPGLYQATIVGALSLVAGFNPALMTAYAIMIHVLQVIPLFFLGVWGAFGTDVSLRSVYQQQQTVPVENKNR